MKELILVDDNDKVTGYMEKDSCHRIPSKKHRAFSIFIINNKGEMLIHKRAKSKNTWPGFWTNACCSHPVKDESIEDAAEKRLNEELGFRCDLSRIFKFNYQADYDINYGENEVDHVLLGIYEGMITPDKGEIEEYSYIDIDTLKKDVDNFPEKYTPWFKAALPEVLNIISGFKENMGRTPK